MTVLPRRVFVSHPKLSAFAATPNSRTQSTPHNPGPQHFFNVRSGLHIDAEAMIRGVGMRHSSNVAAILLTLSTAVTASGASAAGDVLLRRPAAPPAAIGDVRLSPGDTCIVHLASGAVVRARCAGIGSHTVEFDFARSNDAPDRRAFALDEVDVIARMVTMSKARRAWIGAAIVATASLPFGISLVGDMVVPAAIAGALIGYNTGEERAEIVDERRR
jgi:hypothetical protein